MYPASDRFFQSIKGAHRAMVVVKALSIDGTFTNIPITAGSVKIDRTSADVRRSFNISLNSESLIPKLASDPLNIYGNHLYIYRGVIWNMDSIGT